MPWPSHPTRRCSCKMWVHVSTERHAQYGGCSSVCHSPNCGAAQTLLTGSAYTDCGVVIPQRSPQHPEGWASTVPEPGQILKTSNWGTEARPPRACPVQSWCAFLQQAKWILGDKRQTSGCLFGEGARRLPSRCTRKFPAQSRCLWSPLEWRLDWVHVHENLAVRDCHSANFMCSPGRAMVYAEIHGKRGNVVFGKHVFIPVGGVASLSYFLVDEFSWMSL